MIINLPVRAYHLDGYNHVNNARYLEFLEEARWQYYDNISKEALQTSTWAFVIVNINIDYKFPATLGDVLRIDTQVEKMGNTSMTFQQTVYLNESEKIVCSALVTFVILDKQSGRPLPIDGEIKQVLLKEIMI